MIPVNKIYEISTLLDCSVCADSRMSTNEFVSFKKILHKSAIPISMQHSFVLFINLIDLILLKNLVINYQLKTHYQISLNIVV